MADEIDIEAPTESYRADDYDQLNAPEGNLEAGQATKVEVDSYRSEDYDALVKSGAIVVATKASQQAGEVRPSETETFEADGFMGIGGKHAEDSTGTKSVTAKDAQTKDVKPSDSSTETK